MDHTVAAFLFAPPIDCWIRRLKYDRRLIYARILGELLADVLEARAGGWPELIIPVPLHPARLRQRGFNQALEIARPIARRIDRPIGRTAATRVRDTPPQAELPLARRRRNLDRAFRCRDARLPERIAIVDDVVTSGATVHTLAGVLKENGARHVQVWTVARTERGAPTL